MFDALKRIAGGNKSPTSEELRAARDEIDEAALSRAVGAAEASLRDALVGGDEKAVERAEQQIATARRSLDRARAAAEIISERIVIAEQAEAAATLDAERAAVEAEAAAAADALKKMWPGIQMKAVALLNRLDAAEQAVAEVNRKLHAAGRGDEVVGDVEWRARPRPRFQHESSVAITSNVSLPDIEEWGLRGYGGAISRALSFWSSQHCGSGVPETDRPRGVVYASPGVTAFSN